LSDFERHVDRHLVVDADDDPGAGVGFEPWVFHLDGIRTGYQQRKNVVAGPVGDGVEMDAGVDVSGFDPGTRDQSVRWIGYAPEESTSGFLCSERQHDAAKGTHSEPEQFSSAHPKTPLQSETSLFSTLVGVKRFG
jgi:hypothetical protein